jgi:hypothetical protein
VIIAAMRLTSSDASCYHSSMFRHGGIMLVFVLAILALPPSSYAKECKCRLYEKRVEVGAFACVNGKLAQCMMFQNNPSWKFLSDTCPISRKSPAEPAPRAKLAAR